MRTTRTGGMQRKARIAVMLIALLCFAFAPAGAYAGKEGIYLSENVYFTLEKVRLTEGSDDSILRFAVVLHNGGGSTVDYNDYGACVTDSSGFSYSAQLTGTQSARVQPGREQSFSYETRVAKGVTPEQLRVTMFGWSFGAAASMNDIASFSVANAMQENADTVQEAIVPLIQADATLASDARVAFSVSNEYLVYENSRWNVYADLLATNQGGSGVTLPAGLKMRLENAEGQQMAVTAIDGADQSLLPGKPQRITVHAEIPDGDAGKGWSLQFYAMNGDAATVLDSLDIGGTPKLTAIGDSRAVTDGQGRQTVSLKVVSALVSQGEDGQWVRTVISATNSGTRVVPVPALSAKYQSKDGGVTVTATDTETHPAYLSQGETETFSFTGQLPKGMTPEELQLAVFETRTGDGVASSGSNGGANGGAEGGTSGSGANASAGSSGSAASSGSVGKATVPVLVAALQQAEIYSQGSGAAYTPGDPIELPLDHKFDIAVTDLRLYDNENYGFKTAVAKVKMTNADRTAYALPELAIDVVDGNGRIYTGTRQANVISQLATNSSYLVTYSFIMPDAEDGQPVSLRFYNGGDSIPIGAVNLELAEENTTDDVWDAYPYRITVKEGDLLVGQLSATFTYTLRLDVNVERREQLIEDASVSKLQFEIEDGIGLVLAEQALPFQGATKLLNGGNTVSFSNMKLDQFSSNNYVSVYETIDTPNGVVKRKLGEIQ